ncbi:MAG: ExbD/TolR family protein [bacterium]
MEFQQPKKRKVGINITSLIDVLFLLLIFFMVSSTFLEQPGIKLELPQAQSSVMVQQKDYTLFLDKKGVMHLNNEAVTIKNLQNRLIKALPKMKEGALILKADQDATHGKVVQIMDIAKRSGVKKLIIGTKVEE